MLSHQYPTAAAALDVPMRVAALDYWPSAGAMGTPPVRFDLSGGMLARRKLVASTPTCTRPGWWRFFATSGARSM